MGKRQKIIAHRYDDDTLKVRKEFMDLVRKSCGKKCSDCNDSKIVRTMWNAVKSDISLENGLIKSLVKWIHKNGC